MKIWLFNKILLKNYNFLLIFEIVKLVKYINLLHLAHLQHFILVSHAKMVNIH